MSLSREEKLDRLLDERELLQLSHDYCRAIDRADVELLDSLYLPGALDEHGFNTTNTARELIDALPANRAAMEETQHHLSTHAFHVEGDRAEGEVYVWAWHRFVEDGEARVLVIGGRFLDRYERHDGAWKIAHRRAVEHFSVPAPAPGDRGESMIGSIPRAGIGEDDPAHEFFEVLR